MKADVIDQQLSRLTVRRLSIAGPLGMSSFNLHDDVLNVATPVDQGDLYGGKAEKIIALKTGIATTKQIESNIFNGCPFRKDCVEEGDEGAH